MTQRWAVEWNSRSRDGIVREFMWEKGLPLLFWTRSEAKTYIDNHYGYIRTRKDLRMEPHCWRMPRPVKVQVILRRVR